MADEKVLQVAVVSVNRKVWSGEAKSVVVKTVEGDLGILPGHEPVLAILADGPLRVTTADENGDESTLYFAVHGGFFALDHDQLNVLVEYTEMSEEIDVERAKAAKARHEGATTDNPDEMAALKRAETRLEVAGTAQGN